MTPPDRGTLAAAVGKALAPYYDELRHGMTTEDASKDIADALLVGPLATPGGTDEDYADWRQPPRRTPFDAAPGPEGEAVERVRAHLDETRAVARFADDGRCCDHTDLRSLLAAVDRLTAALRGAETHVGALILERDAARDLAFRAAFAPSDPLTDVPLDDALPVVRALRGRWPNDPALDPLYSLLDDIDAGKFAPPAPSPGSGEDGGDG